MKKSVSGKETVKKTTSKAKPKVDPLEDTIKAINALDADTSIQLANRMFRSGHREGYALAKTHVLEILKG